MPKLNHCWGCFDLQTGGLIIGSLEAISGFIGTLICSFVIVQGYHIKLEFDDGHSANGFNLPFHVNEEIFSAQASRTDLTICGIVFLIISIFQMCISSLLIHAIQKKSSTLMTVWIIFKAVFMVLLVIILFLSIIHPMPIEGTIKGAFFFVVIGLNASYLDVIYSLMHQFKSEADGLPRYTDLQKHLNILKTSNKRYLDKI